MGCGGSNPNSSEGDDDVSKIKLAPTASTETVFVELSKCCGITDNTLSGPFVEKLNLLWYYRSIDLLEVNDEILNELKMPTALKNAFLKYVENCQQNELYTNFKEPAAKNKDLQQVLTKLKTENASYLTSNHIKIISETLDKLYLINIDKLKRYLDEQIWNEIQVPNHLKTILLRRMSHKFEGVAGELNKAEGSLYPNIGELKDDIKSATDRGIKNYVEKKEHIEATASLREICTFLANDLLIPLQKMEQHLKPFADYKYNRLYHLSKISDNVFNKLLLNAPKCLKMELYDIISNVRKYNVDSLPFYEYSSHSNATKKKSSMMRLKDIDIDWTMKTDALFDILEQDLNISKGELSQDCNLLMSNFYSNLWDWPFVPDRFWKTLPYYNKFEIVRVRIYELMDICIRKYNINDNKSIPRLPELWLSKYDTNLSIQQILFGGNKKQFTFDGLDWNQITINKTQLINEYLNKNYVGKLHLIAEDHCSNNDVWTQHMSDNQIPQHIRFKINFYSIRGQIQTDDDWLNDYMKNNYPNLPPQYTQKLNVSASSIMVNVGMKEENQLLVEGKFDNNDDDNVVISEVEQNNQVLVNLVVKTLKCNQCKQMKREDFGHCDDNDGEWYCDECWDEFNK